MEYPQAEANYGGSVLRADLIPRRGPALHADLQARRRRKPKRPKRDHYDTDSYRRAIEYGLKKAKKVKVEIAYWHPHQLRHNRGTEVRKKYGIEAAQVALGHARADVTQVYAEKNLEMAMKIARETG
jgi:integrase